MLGPVFVVWKPNATTLRCRDDLVLVISRPRVDCLAKHVERLICENSGSVITFDDRATIFTDGLLEGFYTTLFWMAFLIAPGFIGNRSMRIPTAR